MGLCYGFSGKEPQSSRQKAENGFLDHPKLPNSFQDAVSERGIKGWQTDQVTRRVTRWVGGDGIDWECGMVDSTRQGSETSGTRLTSDCRRLGNGNQQRGVKGTKTRMGDTTPTQT